MLSFLLIRLIHTPDFEFEHAATLFIKGQDAEVYCYDLDNFSERDAIANASLLLRESTRLCCLIDAEKNAPLNQLRGLLYEISKQAHASLVLIKGTHEVVDKIFMRNPTCLKADQEEALLAEIKAFFNLK